MLFMLLVVVFLFAVAFFQAMHGFFSALIMMVLTLCSAAVAIGTYEYVANNWTIQLWPQFAHPLALAGTFGVTLAVMRVIFDQVIKRGNLLPQWLERVGGGLCGLVTGLVITGILGLTINSLPFDRGNFLTYSRINYVAPELPKVDVRAGQDVPDPIPQDPLEEQELWLHPDRFAVASGAYLADNIFGVKDKSFRDTHTDLVQRYGWNNAVPLEMQRWAPPGSISLVEGGIKKVPRVYVYNREWQPATDEASKPIEPESGHEFWAVRIQLSSKSKGEYSFNAFTPRQVMLAGRPYAGGPLKQYYPIALEGPDGSGKHMHTVRYSYGPWRVIDMSFTVPEKNNDQIEVVYDLPQGFRAEYVEYKLDARAPVSFVVGETDPSTLAGGSGATSASGASKPDGADSTQKTADAGGSGAGQPGGSGAGNNTGGGQKPGETVPNSGRGGNVRGVTTRVGKSNFGSQAPFPLRKYTPHKDAEIRAGVLKQGHLVAYADEQEGATGEAVTSFEVPADKRLLQLNVMNLKAGSLYGKVLRQAVVTIQNYFVTDSNGERYQLCGKCAVSIVNGRETLEMQYFPEQAGSIGGVGPFMSIKERDLDKDDTLILLFLVNPGATIVEFSTGGAATRADDLRAEGLTAPK